MNKQPNPQMAFLQFMLQVQHLARQDARSDRGYAMLMTSMISIAMLSLLAAYTTLPRMISNSKIDDQPAPTVYHRNILSANILADLDL